MICDLKLRVGEFLRKFLKYREALENHVMRHACADPEKFRAAEIVAGYHQQVFRLRPLRKRLGAAAGSLDKKIERAVGIGALIAVGGQRLIQRGAVAVIGLDIGAQTRTAGHHPLEQRGRTNMPNGPGGSGDGGKDLIAVLRLVGDTDVANALTRQGQGFGVGITDDGVPVKRGDEGNLVSVIDQLPVGFVGNDVNGMAILSGLFSKRSASFRRVS